MFEGGSYHFKYDVPRGETHEDLLDYLAVASNLKRWPGQLSGLSDVMAAWCLAIAETPGQATAARRCQQALPITPRALNPSRPAALSYPPTAP